MIRRGWLLAVGGGLCLALVASEAAGQGRTPGWSRTEATPTRVMVRAVANDAKVIGSGVGGARITIRESGTGAVLAEGVQEGSTGSTEGIMRTPRARGLTAYGADPEAAGFLATLDLVEPTRVEISAEGPLGMPGAMQRATKTLLLLPGRDIVGEGVILVLNGFTVELLEPAPAAVDPETGGDRAAAGAAEESSQETAGGRAKGAGAVRVAGGPIRVRAKVTMLCGCPTEPGGLWDSEQMEIVARLILDGGVVAEVPLAYGGERSVHVGELPDPGPGPAVVEVIAADPARANFGLARREVLVTR
ncbi:MAG: hypothetical protein ACE5HP_08230 [Gemmatimonadota bacterium]